MKPNTTLLPIALTLCLTLVTALTWRVLEGDIVSANMETESTLSQRSNPTTEPLPNEPNAESSVTRSVDLATEASEQQGIIEGSIEFDSEEAQSSSDGQITVRIESPEESNEQTAPVTSGRFTLRAKPGDRVLPMSILIHGNRALAAEEVLIVEKDEHLILHCSLPRCIELHILNPENGTPRDRITVLRSDRLDALPPATSTYPKSTSVLVEQGRSPLTLVPPTDALPLSNVERLFVRAPGTAWAVVDVDWRAGGARRIELQEAAQLEVAILGRIADLPADAAEYFVRIRDMSEISDQPMSSEDEGEGDEDEEAPALSPEPKGKVETARAQGLLGSVRNELPLPIHGVATFEALVPGRYAVTVERGNDETSATILGLEPVLLSSRASRQITVVLETQPQQ